MLNKNKLFYKNICKIKRIVLTGFLLKEWKLNEPFIARFYIKRDGFGFECNMLLEDIETEYVYNYILLGWINLSTEIRD